MNDDIRELLRDIRSWFTEPYLTYYDRTLVAKNLRDRIDAALKAPHTHVHVPSEQRVREIVRQELQDFERRYHKLFGVYP